MNGRLQAAFVLRCFGHVLIVVYVSTRCVPKIDRRYDAKGMV